MTLVRIKGIKSKHKPPITSTKERSTTTRKIKTTQQPVFSILKKEIDLAGQEFEDIYLRLKMALKSDIKRANLDDLLDQLDKSHTNSLESIYLLSIVRERLADQTRKCQIESAEWETQVDAILTDMKAKKTISGQITEAVRKKYMLKQFPEFREMEQRREELERHKKLMKVFAELCISRTDTIRSLIKHTADQNQKGQ